MHAATFNLAGFYECTQLINSFVQVDIAIIYTKNLQIFIWNKHLHNYSLQHMYICICMVECKKVNVM